MLLANWGGYGDKPSCPVSAYHLVGLDEKHWVNSVKPGSIPTQTQPNVIRGEIYLGSRGHHQDQDPLWSFRRSCDKIEQDWRTF